MSYDICIVGSGAGASPVAHQLALAGAKVIVLEKGPWLTEEDFYKDEIAISLRDAYNPKLTEEQHVIEEEYEDESDEFQKSLSPDVQNNIIGPLDGILIQYILKNDNFSLFSYCFL